MDRVTSRRVKFYASILYATFAGLVCKYLNSQICGTDWQCSKCHHPTRLVHACQSKHFFKLHLQCPYSPWEGRRAEDDQPQGTECSLYGPNGLLESLPILQSWERLEENVKNWKKKKSKRFQFPKKLIYQCWEEITTSRIWRPLRWFIKKGWIIFIVYKIEKVK